MDGNSAKAADLPWDVRAGSPTREMPEIAPERQRKRKRETTRVGAATVDTETRSAVDHTATTALPRGIIPGYPRKDAPLPPSIEDEELIKRFPNHLYGENLLRLSDRGWGAKEIVDTAQCPALKANTLTKRIQNEKLKRDGLREARPRKQARQAASGTGPSLQSPQAGSIPGPAEPLESEAGRRFRMEQMAIRDIALQMKPDMFTRTVRCAKRAAADDRVIAHRAAEEYEKSVVRHGDTS